MPVNKLWLEHTERAAWESVQALRKKLADAEAQMQRMAPPAAGWQQLFGALDAALQQHTLVGATYAESIQGMLKRMAEAETRSAAMAEELARLRNRGRPSAIPSESSYDAPAYRWRSDANDDESEREVDHFAEAVEHRYRTMRRDPALADIDAVLRAIDARLDTLGDPDDPAALDAVVELGALAACLATAMRRHGGSEPG
jgi:hypothetical protein